MTALTLDKATTIVAAALRYAREKSFKPLAVTILDERGALKAFAAEDGTSLRRAEIAHGKAHAVLSMGLGGRELERRAKERPHFINAVTHVVGGSFIPAPGGVLIKDTSGHVVGSVGVSGDHSGNDEEAAVAGIKAANFTADTGADGGH